MALFSSQHLRTNTSFPDEHRAMRVAHLSLDVTTEGFAGKNVSTFSKHYPATVRGVVYLDRQI